MKFIAKEWLQIATELGDGDEGRYGLMIIHKTAGVYAYMPLAYLWNFLDKDEQGEEIETRFLPHAEFDELLAKTQAACKKFEGFDK